MNERSLSRVLSWALPIAMLVGGGLYLDMRWDRQQAQARSRVHELATAQADVLRHQLERSISSVHAIGAMLTLNGAVPDFPSLAAEIISSYGGITNLQLAPGGRIAEIHPLAGNEAALGLDLLDHGTPGSAAAWRALNERRTVVVGPLHLVQGGIGLVARRPVFVPGDTGERFWGFVTALISVDDLVRISRLGELAAAGYVYRLSAVERRPEMHLAGDPQLAEMRPVSFRFVTAGVTMDLSIAPRPRWGDPVSQAIEGGAVVLSSLLLAFLLWSQLRRPDRLVELVRAQTADLERRQQLLQAQVERVRSLEQALRENEVRLASLLENASEALVVHDRHGRLLEVNPATCRLLDYPREALLGLALGDLEVLRGEEELLDTWAATPVGTSRVYQGRLRSAGGLDLPVDVRVWACRVQPDAAPTYVAALHDASRREASRDELEQANAELEQRVVERTAELAEVNRALTVESRTTLKAQEALDRARLAAEEANAEKSRFLALISHEIRTPMNGLLGMVSLLKDAEMTHAQKEYVVVADASGQLLMELLGELVDVSRIESARLELRPREVPLAPLFEQVTSLHRWRAEEKGITLVLALDPELPDGVVIDPLRLRQVLHNLVSNALKFTDEGRIEIRVATPRSDTLEFAVIDTGVGIPEPAQKAIFESYSQADESIARRYGGTGLGLTITHQIVETMGGTIGLQSRPGSGSTFTVTVPATAVRSIAGRVPDPASGQYAGARVLIAEDNAVNRQVAEGMLARFGCSTTSVKDGREALSALVAERYDLVLMDCQMPELDGLEATRRLRRHAGPVARVPVVAMTADALPEDRARCIAAGMDDYLAKPVTVEALRAVLDRWCATA